MTTRYLAGYRHGGPSLIAFEVERETAKTVVAAGRAGISIIGFSSYVGKVIAKDDPVFDTQAEAAHWLRSFLARRAEELRRQIAAIEAWDADLAKLEEPTP